MPSSALLLIYDAASIDNDPLSLHDALPIFANTVLSELRYVPPVSSPVRRRNSTTCRRPRYSPLDRKSTRLNSSHANISYAAFRLKKNSLSSPFERRPGNICRRQRFMSTRFD